MSALWRCLQGQARSDVCLLRFTVFLQKNSQYVFICVSLVQQAFPVSCLNGCGFSVSHLFFLMALRFFYDDGNDDDGDDGDDVTSGFAHDDGKHSSHYQHRGPSHPMCFKS